MLASTEPEASYIGHRFNATTRLKMVPLPSQHIPELSSINKGIRGVCLHSTRYNPALNTSDAVMQDADMIRYSDSMTDLLKQKQRQEVHFEHELQQLGKARKRKSTHKVNSHRADCMFYMHGHSANINRRSMFSADEIKQLKVDSISENKQLYYGRGLTRLQNKLSSRSRTLAKLQDTLNSETDNFEFIHDTLSRGQTPSVSFSIPTPPPPDAVYGKKATFITEESS